MLISFWGKGQNSNVLSLNEAVILSITNSKMINAENTNIAIAKSKSQAVKEARLPDFGVSGTFMYLPFAPNVNLKTQSNASSSDDKGTSPQAGFPVPKTILYGGLNASMPIFTGFKLKNSLIQSEQGIEAAEISATIKTENVAFQTVNLYFAMYKTQQMIQALEENLGRSEQRIIDFKNFVNNGLLAQNDLLKAELQKSNVLISLEEAQNTYNKLQYKLNTWLQKDVDTKIAVDIATVNIPLVNEEIDNRSDLNLLKKQLELRKTGVELTRGAYFPNLALTGGYLNAYVPNLLTVTNAVNFGLAVKYNISSLYKNKSEMKTSNLMVQQAQENLTLAQDNAKIENNEAVSNYKLNIKKQKVYDQAFDQAKENLRIVTNKNKNGLADTDQLLEADIQQLQAEINQRIGLADQQLAWYNVLFTSGSLLDYFKTQKKL